MPTSGENCCQVHAVTYASLEARLTRVPPSQTRARVWTAFNTGWVGTAVQSKSTADTWAKQHMTKQQAELYLLIPDGGSQDEVGAAHAVPKPGRLEVVYRR